MEVIYSDAAQKFKKGQKTSFMLAVAESAGGGDMAIPIHVISGRKEGPRLVIVSTQHGVEYTHIEGLRQLFTTVSPEDISGEIVIIPVANPMAFDMGTRCSVSDALWDNNGNMASLWPGREHGWITERFIAKMVRCILNDATAVIDMHTTAPWRVINYGYWGGSDPIASEVSKSFGHAILVESTMEELAEKGQASGTCRMWCRDAGKIFYGAEMGDFYGLEDERDPGKSPACIQSITESVYEGVCNVMKQLSMLPGKPSRPKRQVIVSPELNLRPRHGGLLRSALDHTAVGRVVPRGTELARVLSPYKFSDIDVITAPFDQTLILCAASHPQPLIKVNPGDLAYVVADWRTARLVE